MAAPEGPIVVEPVVSPEKLRDLLARGTEYPTLEFKRELHIEETEGIVELARDVGAMQVQGGYIVIGVDGRGSPSGLVPSESQMRYDEATLRPRLHKYLPESISILSKAHEIEDRLVVLLYVAPHPEGCAFFKADGQYVRAGKTVVAFSEGAVFWRDGTRSVRMSQAGLQAVMRRQLEASRRELEREFRSGHEQRSLDNLTLDMEASALVRGALEAVRRGDAIGRRHLFVDAVASARVALERDDIEVEFGVIIDKLVCVAAAAQEYSVRDLFSEVVRCFQDLFALGYTSDFSPYSLDLPRDLRGPRVWLAIAERVYGLGALSVRREDWQSVRELAGHRVRDTDRTTSPWLRHALTMASRAGHLTSEAGGRQEKLSLLSLARAHIGRLECLRADGIAYPSDPELNSLAQFDVLVALAVIADAERLDERDFYPNFSRFYSERVSPIVARVIALNSEVREAIFPRDDVDLAHALETIEKWAQREGWNYAGFHDFGAEVEDWIAQHRADATRMTPDS
jgi:Putative DNA-binding domain